MKSLINSIENFMILRGKTPNKITADAIYTYEIEDYKIQYIESIYFENDMLKIEKNGDIILLKGDLNEYLNDSLNNLEHQVNKELSDKYLFGLPIRIQIELGNINKMTDTDINFFKKLMNI